MTEPSPLQRQLNNPENLRTILGHVARGWYGRSRYGPGRTFWLAERGWADHPAQGEHALIGELIRQHLVEEGPVATVAVRDEGTCTVVVLQLSGPGARQLAALRQRLNH
jgi:hypothetical protein